MIIPLALDETISEPMGVYIVLIIVTIHYCA